MNSAEMTGQRIAQLREDRGWNHERMVKAIHSHPELGGEFSVSESTIRRAERGAPMTTASRYAIATVFGLTPSALFGSLPPRRRRRQATATQIGVAA